MEIRPFEKERDLDGVLDLYRATYGNNPEVVSKAVFLWRHFGYPDARSLGLVGTEGGNIIGVQPMEVYPFVAPGFGEFLAAVLSGVVVHEAHRRKGVFSRLIKACEEMAASEGADFLLTFPNDRSYRGFLKLGWTDLGDRVLMGKPLGLLARAFVKAKGLFRRESKAKARGAFEVFEVKEVSSKHEELIKTTQELYPALQQRRDWQWFRWRYLEAPWPFAYSLFEARRKGGGEPEALVVCRRKNFRGVLAAFVMDVFGKSEDAVCRCLEGSMKACARAGDRVGISVLSFGEVVEQHREACFFLAPPFLPIKRFHTVFKPISRRALLWSEVALWHLTFGDWDNL